MSQAARSLDINVNMLRRWKYQIEEQPNDALSGKVLAPVKNFTKITGFKVAQAVLKAQSCLDALSQKKGASGYEGHFSR